MGGTSTRCTLKEPERQGHSARRPVALGRLAHRGPPAHSLWGQARGVWNQARAATRRRLDQGVPLMGCEDLASLAAGTDTAERGVLANAPSQPLPQRRSDLARAFHEAVDPAQPRKHLAPSKSGGGMTRSGSPKGRDGGEPGAPAQTWLGDVLPEAADAGRAQEPHRQPPRPPRVCPRPDRAGGGRPRAKAPTDWGAATWGVHFLALSDGTVGDAPRAAPARRRPPRARVQRTLARQVKFSKNWTKTKRRLNALHARIADRRREFVQRLSPTVSPHHATVALTRSSRGAVCVSRPPESRHRGKGWGRLATLLDAKGGATQRAGGDGPGRLVLARVPGLRTHGES